MTTKHDLIPALGAGLLGGVMLAVMSGVSLKLGLMRLNFGRMLGTFLGPDSSRRQAMGWAMHVLNGALFALGYREVYRRTGLQPSRQSGTVLGLGHFGAAMLALLILPRLHPRPGQAGLRPLGLFRYGPMTVPGMLMAHAVYGAIVGWFLERATYARPELPRDTKARPFRAVTAPAQHEAEPAQAG